MKMPLYFAQNQKPIYTFLCFQRETWTIGRSKSKPFILFIYLFASSLESGPGSSVTVPVLSGWLRKAIGLPVHCLWYLDWF